MYCIVAGIMYTNPGSPYIIILVSKLYRGQIKIAFPVPPLDFFHLRKLYRRVNHDSDTVSLKKFFSFLKCFVCLSTAMLQSDFLLRRYLRMAYQWLDMSTALKSTTTTR
jgi:hypothetical protein